MNNCGTAQTRTRLCVVPLGGESQSLHLGGRSSRAVFHYVMWPLTHGKMRSPSYPLFCLPRKPVCIAQALGTSVTAADPQT